MATAKQTRYIMSLLDRTGFSTRYMDSRFKALGARMAERQGRTEDWVRDLTLARASELIDELQRIARSE